MEYNRFDFSNKEKIKLLGKTSVKESSLVLPWSYGGFEFNFNGTGFILHFAQFSDEQPAYVRVFIGDYSRKYCISSGKEKVIFEDLPEERHNVKVIRITEGLASLEITGVDLMGEAPELCEKPQDKKLKLFFIGDSITCGYGIAAPASVPVFNTYEEDCTMSYAYRAAKLLDADICFTGASGKGIVANCMGDREDMTLRQAFTYETRQGGCWDFNNYSPDWVIVNGGTNDAWGGVTEEEFFDTSLVFANEIMEKYPSAKLLFAYGIMDTSRIACVNRVADKLKESHDNVYFLKLDSMYAHSDETGGGGHPNRNTTARVAPILAQFIASNS